VTTPSLPTLASFEEAYRRLTSQGCDIVSIHMSSKISGTFNAALIASTSDGVPADRIAIVDSRTISMAEGWVAVRTAEAAREGKSLDEIESLAIAASRRARVFGALDTLEYV